MTHVADSLQLLTGSPPTGEARIAETQIGETLPGNLPAGLDALLRAAGLGVGGLYWKLGIRITEAEPDRVCGTMPVEGNTQPYGLLHGGASIAFAETLASTASVLYAGRNRRAVGVKVSATHHRAVRSGLVHGTATAVECGAALVTYEVQILDDERRRVCTCRITCMLLTDLGGRPADDAQQA